MIELEGFAAHDRVLVAAPHPDDESIATGGVLQAARAAGAACRVLLVTDGDNNPWPQRWADKRWTIGAAERARWGARRRAEALAALAVLGVPADDVRCLGLPDLGLTAQLMDARSGLIERLRAELDEFRPTRVFMPAAADRHPDHSALHVLMRLALTRCAGILPRLHTFGVHGAATDPAARVVLTLTPAQRDTKRRAIEQHATQMILSRRRFVGYARECEPFGSAPEKPMPDPTHPLQAGFAADGDLRVRIEETRWHGPRRDRTLFVVIDDAQAPARMSIPLNRITASGDLLKGDATLVVLEGTSAHPVVRIRTPPHAQAGWVKLGRTTPGLFVLDRHGWQAIAAPRS